MVLLHILNYFAVGDEKKLLTIPSTDEIKEI